MTFQERYKVTFWFPLKKRRKNMKLVQTVTNHSKPFGNYKYNVIFSDYIWFDIILGQSRKSLFVE